MIQNKKEIGLMSMHVQFIFRTTDEEPKSRTTPQLTTTTEKSTIITDEITGDFFRAKNKNPHKNLIYLISLTILVQSNESNNSNIVVVVGMGPGL